MDKWKACCVASVRPSSDQSCHHCVRAHMALCTQGESNTPPNPPLTVLLTQLILHGVECCHGAVAKLWLLRQQRLGLVMSARCVLAAWALTRPTHVEDNEGNSAVMPMTVFSCMRRCQRRATPNLLEACVRHWVGGRPEFSTTGFTTSHTIHYCMLQESL